MFLRAPISYSCWRYQMLLFEQSYQLTYRVFDEKHSNTTTVIVNVLDVTRYVARRIFINAINVLDVNDNPPKFDNAIYNVTNVVEEEIGISKNNPKYLLTVCWPHVIIYGSVSQTFWPRTPVFNLQQCSVLPVI